ncbi:DUF2313 domain-containing protein [Virgibacillus halodenitrificans]|uniref:putative phage tail protein n=1 Tax=Virgibacillus halodenitrificans TaxID=1482 RepID=UPI00136E0CA9|nr:putative phage tail protein [Virgibacillus halodenitrificans]MYL45064.1 DUF2313 domain-containing protein [Virgibacillus halodenitrificans]
MMFIQPGSKSNERMMDYIPKYYRNSRIMNELMKSRGSEIDELIALYDDILDQFFIETATWKLPDYEKQYGLPVNSQDSLQERRKRVLSKKRSGRANLKSILQAEEPSLTLIWGGSTLFLSIVNDKDRYDYAPLIQLLNRHAPVHLGFGFKVSGQQDQGYKAVIDRLDRFRLALHPIAGTFKSGIYPRRHTSGHSLYRNLGVRNEYVIGASNWLKSAGLTAGSKGKQTTFGVTLSSNLNSLSLMSSGSSEYIASGIKKSGTINTESPGVVSGRSEIVNSVASTGTSTVLRCGSVRSGQEVA